MRQATKHDNTEIIEMVKCFRDESKIEAYKELNNQDYFCRLLAEIYAGRGVVYLEPGKGLIIGVIAPIIWCDKTYAMYELAWWVRPEFRQTTVGYRLVKAYIDFGNKLKDEGRIKLFTLSKLPGTPEMDYSKLGFVQTDENWMQ